MDVNELYVSLNSEDYELLEFPTYGILKRKRTINTIKEKGEIPFYNSFKEQTLEFVNKDAVTVLKLCDGKRTVGKILYLFPDNDKVKQFLLQAVHKKHVILKEEPLTGELTIKGTKDFFMPSHLVIELTDNCNLNCIHCYRIRDGKEGTFINAEKLQILLKNLANETACGVELTGGEPTIHPDFELIVKTAVQHFSIVGVLTNGIYLPDELLEKICNYNNQIFWSISLDSHQPEYHDKFRGKRNAWLTTVENIEKLVKYNFLVRVAMTITPENIKHIEKVAELCVNIGVKVFSYSPVLPFGKARNFSWSAEDLWELANEEEKIREKYKNIIPIVQFEGFAKNSVCKNCGAGWKSVVIDPNFNVRPCVMADLSSDVIGKIDPYNPKTFFENYKDVVFFYANADVPEREICGDCKFLNFCTPCILRVRKVIEERLIEIEKCKWVNKIKPEFFRFFLKNTRGDLNA
ncbi:subtilosin maturase AlbA [Thermoanaerobacter brockii subsp. lactiethylicus]